MTRLDEIANFLADECWIFDATFEQDAVSERIFTINLSCGVQARGRTTVSASTLSECFELAFKWTKEYETR